MINIRYSEAEMTAFEKAFEEFTGKDKDDLPRTQINDGKELSLQQKFLILCWEIEKLPPSDQQTKVITLACELRRDITSMQDRAKELVTSLIKDW